MRFGIILLAVICVLSACQSTPKAVQEHVAQPRDAPIGYNAIDVDDEIALSFLHDMMAGDFKAASSMCSSKFRAIHQDQFQSKRKGLKNYWNEFTEGNQVSISVSSEVLDKDEPLSYFYPASIGNSRALINVRMRENHVVSFMIDKEFELIERILYDLIYEKFEDADSINYEYGFEVVSNSQDMEHEWNKILSETGKFLSSDPPYTTMAFDAVPYYFPSTFENGKFMIKIIIGYVYPKNGKAIFFEVYPISPVD